MATPTNYRLVNTTMKSLSSGKASNVPTMSGLMPDLNYLQNEKSLNSKLKSGTGTNF